MSAVLPEWPIWLATSHRCTSLANPAAIVAVHTFCNEWWTMWNCLTDTESASRSVCRMYTLLSSEALAWPGLFFRTNAIAKDCHVPVLLSLIGGKTYTLLRNLVPPESPGDKSFEHLAEWQTNEVRASQLAQAWERVVLEYQLQNRVENLADVSTRCSGLLQGEDKLARAPIIFIA